MIVVAGVGPGNPKYLTNQVTDAIRSFETVIGFGRVSRSLSEIREDILEVNRVFELLEMVEGKDEVLILASGDPLFFGITNFLKRKGVVIDEIYPGISSFQYFMSQMQLPWSEASFFSLHGRDFDLDKLKTSPLSIGFIDKDNTPTSISRTLYEKGFRGTLHVGYQLSYEEEVIESFPIGGKGRDLSALAVMVIENEMVEG